MSRPKTIILIALVISGTRLFAQSATGDITWKATMDYVLVTDQIDTEFIHMGVSPATVYVSHFTSADEQGTFGSLLSTIEEGINSLKIPVYAMTMTHMDIPPGMRLSKKEVSNMRTRVDTDMGMEGGKKVVITKLGKLRGLGLNQEYFYNTKTNQLEVKITDAYMTWKKEGTDTGRYGSYEFGMLKFCDRTTDSGTGEYQKINQPEIAWADGVPFFGLYCNAQGHACMETASNYKMTYKGDTSGYMTNTPVTQIKRMFDETLAELLYHNALKGKVAAYTYEKDGKVGAKLSQAEVDKLGVLVMNDLEDENGKPIPAMNLVIDDRNIYGLEVVEEVSFNKTTNTLDAKILRAAMVRQAAVNVYPPPPDKSNKIPMFWVKFN